MGKVSAKHSISTCVRACGQQPKPKTLKASVPTPFHFGRIRGAESALRL